MPFILCKFEGDCFQIVFLMIFQSCKKAFFSNHKYYEKISLKVITSFAISGVYSSNGLKNFPPPYLKTLSKFYYRKEGKIAVGKGFWGSLEKIPHHWKIWVDNYYCKLVSFSHAISNQL